jgi:SNF2 family DNA or RNA helicase
VRFFSKQSPLVWSRDESGLAVRFGNPKQFSLAKNGKGDERLQMAFLKMRMLLEEGRADAEDRAGTEISEGVFLESEQAVRLDDETRQLFELASPWPGRMRLEIQGIPQWTNFSAAILLIDLSGRAVRDWRLVGPVLEVGHDKYLPTPEQYAALRAIIRWAAEPKENRSEPTNLLLMAQLNAAKRSGCHIDLDAFGQLHVEQSGEMEVEVSESTGGSLKLLPRFPRADGMFTPQEIESRLHHLGGEDAIAILRLQNKRASRIVLLDEAQTKRARSLIANRKVPASERAAFLRDPSAWLATRVFTEVDAEFSPRVIGVEVWKARYSGVSMESGIDWLETHHLEESISSPSHPEETKADKSTAPSDGSESESADGNRSVVPKIYDNDNEPSYGSRTHHRVDSPDLHFEVSDEHFRRHPLPHQAEAVGWLLAHAERSIINSGIHANRENSQSNVQGGGFLLADDMGLGKSFSILVFLAHWQKRLKKSAKSTKATLVVAPVTLLENWKEEISRSYTNPEDVFARIVYAFPEGDLVRFRTGHHDIAEPGEGDPLKRMRSWGLIFGTGKPDSVDCPSTLVFTTYATLRNYRFSFAACRWSVAVFDEAQNLKNPNALQSVAAKALNADFRVLLTGTPVENHLGDLWSLMDLAEPSFLSSFQQFRKEFISPIETDRQKVVEVGRSLRDKIGTLMVRRLKDRELKGLPVKTTVLHSVADRQEFDPSITAVMQGRQLDAYDAILQSARSAAIDGPTGDAENYWLSQLFRLRLSVLHPDLVDGGRIPIGSSRLESERILRQSGKLATVLSLIDNVRQRGDKVLIFCTTKRLQEALAANLSRIYGFEVPIINGDAPAGTRPTRPEIANKTRHGMITAFQAAEGFRICILSTLAAGVGLTITAANHVIHLERTWNPAKEAQATDRVYRIGASKPVFVYVPILLHPSRDSFDVNLDRLLRSKVQLQDAITLAAPEEVAPSELIERVFGVC